MMAKFQSKIQIVTDGGTRGNPGPAAIAYSIYDENWILLDEGSEYIGKATNNEAEYQALIKALDCATGHCRGSVEHYSDSELVIKQLNGEYRVKASNLKPLIEEVFVKKQYFQSVIHKHLPRSNTRIEHVDNLVNGELDSLGY